MTSPNGSIPSAEVTEYEARGYLVIDDLLPADHISGLRARMEAIAAGDAAGFAAGDIELEPGSNAIRKINRCAQNDPLFRAHAEDCRILDIVESLIGPDIKLYDSQCFMKPPGGVEKPYHQDSAYFCIEPTDLVTCWTALDDVTLENGCMWVIPGSHRTGLLEHADWELGGRVDKQVPDTQLDRAKEAPIVMPAGGSSFHHSVLLHRSRANHTDQPRRGLAVHYMSAKSRWTNAAAPKPGYALLRGQEYPDCV
jgi:ectoine hydroxylase-related dioxygenase (phytanoyl-CoA dioxygenase family)